MKQNEDVTQARRDWALERLRLAQVRLTPVRRLALDLLASQNVPQTLGQLCQHETMAGHFDDATVYRTLVLLVELEVVRQIQLQGRQTHFILNPPGECSTFLVCRCCGTITPVNHGAAVHEMEKRIELAHGYRAVTHNLELFGICPSCHDHQHDCAKPSKLVPRAAALRTCAGLTPARCRCIAQANIADGRYSAAAMRPASCGSQDVRHLGCQASRVAGACRNTGASRETLGWRAASQQRRAAGRDLNYMVQA